MAGRNRIARRVEVGFVDQVAKAVEHLMLADRRVAIDQVADRPQVIGQRPVDGPSPQKRAAVERVRRPPRQILFVGQQLVHRRAPQVPVHQPRRPFGVEINNPQHLLAVGPHKNLFAILNTPHNLLLQSRLRNPMQ
ncbi:MAG: hypothetical protein KatS3mg111_2395 [Pirellulaceae bacterium]|nr:MAG: hypothetical protein KatS3mg111_2395 [Pirellulaceae bacterium]